MMGEQIHQHQGGSLAASARLVGGLCGCGGAGVRGSQGAGESGGWGANKVRIKLTKFVEYYIVAKTNPQTRFSPSQRGRTTRRATKPLLIQADFVILMEGRVYQPQ